MTMGFFKDLGKAAKANREEAKHNAEPKPNVYICKHCGNLRPELNSDGELNMPHVTVYTSDTHEPADIVNFVCWDTPECKALAEEWLANITSMFREGSTATITGGEAFKLGPA